MATQLPRGITEFISHFGGDFTDILRKIADESKLSPSQRLIWKYSGGALNLGRPLDTVMIFMAGQSGAGKSTTINVLFEDENLCPTSSSTSETKDPMMLLKHLNVTAETPTLQANLTFVDVPGSFDTDTRNELVNFASIKKFRESRIELQSRKLTKLNISQKYLPRETVYPNIILFVVKASDNRIIGKNSFFRKSLESFKLHNIFDKEHPNLIIVLSHARALGGKAKFATALKEKTEHIQQIVKEVLGLNNVAVVPIENDGEGQDLEKVGSFYKLANGALSHANLFEAMQNNFNNNEDRLGSLLLGWYFSPTCPEKKNQVIVEANTVELEDLDVALAGKLLGSMQIPFNQESCVPQYNFQSLGRGYCPVTEEIKPDSLIGSLDSLELKIIEVENTKFLIPKFINPFIKKTSRFQRLSFYEKEEYQNHMKASYGIEAGFKLIVSASSHGRWSRDAVGSHGSTLIRMIQEIQLATFKMDNPRDHVTQKFLDELNSLPDNYGDGVAKTFRSFFSKWGTHIICEEAIGGAIKLNCTMERTSLSRESLQEIEAKVSGAFKGFSASGNMDTSSLANGLKTVGVSNEQLEIDGGDPPTLITLESLNGNELKQWVESVSMKPAELRESIKLYPFYNFLNGSKCESLHQATADYLQDTLNSRIQAVIDRETLAQRVIKDAIIAPTPKPQGECFPKGTLVKLWNGMEKPIEALSPADTKMKTMSIRGNFYKETFELDTLAKTSFCTFLDLNSTELIQYLVFHFSNDKKLTLTDGHMIFQYISEGNQVKAKQAKHFSIGEMAVYLSPKNEIETPVIQEITVENHVGSYSPLTTAGTFFADGFLVSSYARTNSFHQAQLALAPLKIWCKMSQKNALKDSTGNDQGQALEMKDREGLHPFAKFLISLRKTFTSLAPTKK